MPLIIGPAALDEMGRTNLALGATKLRRLREGTSVGVHKSLASICSLFPFQISLDYRHLSYSLPSLEPRILAHLAPA